jgi:hypothetical protein
MSDEALERLARFIRTLPTRPGILGRAALGTAAPGDAALKAHLSEALAAEVRADGSVGNAALATIWRLHELLDLDRGPSDPAVGRLLAWLLARHGRPGAFGKGCDRSRHTQGLCEHYVHGFFSIAPPEERLAPITLPSGKVFRAEPAARFALSCLGLRGALRAGLGGRAEIGEHLDSLARVAMGWTEWSGGFAPDAIVAGLHALAIGGAAHRRVTAGLVSLVTRYQSPDGTWPATDPFGMLDALLAVGSDEARRAVRRAGTALLNRQRSDGSFSGPAQQERALIGLRALLWVEGSL